VRFPVLVLPVKYGTEITISEAQCLLFVRKRLKHEVPVPEVFGCCGEGGQVFIYMELVEGFTLEKIWETLEEEEREDVCVELRGMVDAWRGLENWQTPPVIND
jgi:aminoglycoside phosphotransferase (APT) family kinase protein